MKGTKWKKRFAAIAMSFCMVLGSFSGISAYADEEPSADAEQASDPDCGFYTAADMATEHYIKLDWDNPVTYVDGYTVYFVCKNTVDGQTLSVSKVGLNSGDDDEDGKPTYAYTVTLGNTDESGISFVKDSTTSEYTACKLTIPADLDIYNAYVDVTYTSTSEPTETSQGGEWLNLSQLKSGLVQYTGSTEWDETKNSFVRTDTVTQENITKETYISECDYGNYFFGIATVGTEENTSYTDVDISKLSVQKKTDDGWVSTTDGTIEESESETEGYVRYRFTSEGTYAITYTDGSAVSRVIINVSQFDSGYVTDPTDFVKGYIDPEEYSGQTFYYKKGTSDTFYFVFSTYDGKRSVSKDSSDNVLLYRWDNTKEENVETEIDGVTVTKYTDNAKDGYEIYKITLTDSYDFGSQFELRLLTQNDVGGSEIDDRYIDIQLSDEGLNVSEPTAGEDYNPVYDGTYPLSKRKEFTVENTYAVYFVTKSESGVTRYTSVPTVKNLDGTSVDSSVVTIVQNTDSSDRDGLYNVTFHQAGKYLIESTDGSYVIAKVYMPKAAFYSSSVITAANMLTGKYTYKEGEGSLYLAIEKNTEYAWGYTLSWSKDTANEEGKTNAELLKEYGLTATKVDGTEGYDVYKLDMTYGFIATDWMGLNILYTPCEGEWTEDPWVDCVGISLECEPTNGSLVASWGVPTKEEDGVKIMWVNARCNYLYLATVTGSADSSGCSYSLVTADASEIKIESLDGSKAPKVEKTDVEGQYKFSLVAGITDGTYCVTVGNSHVIIKKSAEIEVLYKADNEGNFTLKDEYDFSDTFDITTAKTENERTFYAYFSQERLGEENAFHYVYVGDPDKDEYYYFADLLTGDSTKNWAGTTITKNTSGKVTVVKQTSPNEGDVLLKITVSDSAVGENFIIGAAIRSNGVTDTEPWVEDKDVLVLKVTATVDKENSTKLDSAVDDGYVTITEVPAIEDLDLAANLGLVETDQGDDTSLSEDEATSAQKVEVSIKTEEIKVDENNKVVVASDATEKVKKAAEKQQTAVTEILEKKDTLLSVKYSATFLDLSITATVTKKATSDTKDTTTEDTAKEDKVTVPITETKQPLTIKVPIPKDLKEMRGFSIIRYHEDVQGKKLTDKIWANVVYDTDKKTPLYLEFQTDKFSTYALAYREANATDDLDLSGAEWKVTGDKNFVYDGTEKSIKLEVSGLKGCTYTLKGTTKETKIGEYTVYVDEVTYNGVTYPASEVDLPETIANGFTWSIKKEITEEDKDSESSGSKGSGYRGGGGSSSSTSSSNTDNASDKTDDTASNTGDTANNTGDTANNTGDTANNSGAGSNTTDDTSNGTDTVTTVKKGDTTKKSGNTYTVTSATKKTVAFTSVKKNAKTVTIPSKVTINGVSYKVTSIAANAFKNDKKLTKVVIPSSVIKIGDKAFKGCTSLKTVTLTKATALTTIGAGAFYGCTKLTSVTIPKNVKSIGKQAFYNCSKLSKVTIKSTKIKTIGSKAFTKIAKKPTIKVPSKKKTAYKKLLKKAGYTKTVK